jgi:hypothetical protein
MGRNSYYMGTGLSLIFGGSSGVTEIKAAAAVLKVSGKATKATLNVTKTIVDGKTACRVAGKAKTVLKGTSECFKAWKCKNSSGTQSFSSSSL